MCSNNNCQGLGLSDYVEMRLSKFLDSHSEEVTPTNVYHVVVDEVERAVIKTVMNYAGDNQLKASKILGINRNTLRKKLELL